MEGFLSSYIFKENEHQIVNKVNIRYAIEEYKSNHPDVSQPIVVFDFMGTIPILFPSPTEDMCAGRHNLRTRRAEDLFKKFKDLGVDMVFFLDGPIKEIKMPEWIRRKNHEYDELKKLFFSTSYKYEEPINYEFPKYVNTYFENCLFVAKKYGRVFISIDNEYCLDLAEFATRTKPMAVVASDSNFMIMAGDWPIWLPLTLNVECMTVKAINKEILRKSLGLEQWQMPILATLLGNDWIEYKHVEHIRKPYIKPTDDIVKTQKAFAHFIREIFKTREDLHIKLTDLIYNGGSGELSYEVIIKLVDVCLKLYDYKTHKITRVEPDWLRDHITQTASDHVLQIFKNRILRIPQSFVYVPMDDVSSFSDLILPLMRREIGIMYSNQRKACQDCKLRVCLKPSDTKPYCVQEYTPLYPDFQVPEIEDILSNDEDIVSVEERVKLYAWVVSPKRKKLSTECVLKLLKTIFIIPALLVNYLVQERQITEDEADVLLLAILEASKADEKKIDGLRPPETIRERPFWLSHVYTTALYHFIQAMIFCGLNDFVPASHFDGYMFHEMYARFAKMTYEDKQKMKETVAGYRIYAP